MQLKALIRRLAPVLIFSLGLFLFHLTTHHHDSPEPESRCDVCHLGYTITMPLVATVVLFVFTPRIAEPALPLFTHITLVPSTSARRRAPPSAR